MVWTILIGIASIIVWIELIVKIINFKNASSVTTFLSYPFGKPASSMVCGLVIRVVLIAAASIGLWYSASKLFNI